MSEAVVIIPARDEALTIAEIVRRTKAMGHHVLLVDDASTDGTALIAYKAGAEVLRLDRPRGNLRAIQAGMAWMLDHRKLRPSWLITLDADGQHMPEEVPLLLAEAKKCRNTLIIGSCPERSSWMRQMVWAFFRLISGLQVNDMTSGFKVYPVRAASVLCGPKTENLGYQDVPTLLFLSRRGFKICEIAVNMAPRRSGKSRVFSSWSKVTLYMFKVTRLCCFHRLAVLAKK